MTKKISETIVGDIKKVQSKKYRQLPSIQSDYTGLSDTERAEIKEWEKQWSEVVKLITDDNKRLLAKITK